MTPQELNAYKWKLELDSKIAHKKQLERIADFKRSVAKLQRLQEDTSYWWLKHDVESARRNGKTMSVALAQKWTLTQAEVHGVVFDAEAKWVPVWKQHADDLARQLGITVEWVPIVGNINAYASQRTKRIECSPVRSAYSYATFLHEAGHCVHQCEATHTRVAVEEKALNKTVCVRCELNAWGWAYAAAKPRWTDHMHACLTGALPSYRRYGTASEQREIDWLASGLGFKQIQLERARRA